MVNFMHIGGANITDDTPLHNSFTSIGGRLAPTEIPVRMPHVNATDYQNPRLPSQQIRIAQLEQRKRAIFSKIRDATV